MDNHLIDQNRKKKKNTVTRYWHYRAKSQKSFWDVLYDIAINKLKISMIIYYSKYCKIITGKYSVTILMKNCHYNWDQVITCNVSEDVLYKRFMCKSIIFRKNAH